MWPKAKLKYVTRLDYGETLPRDEPQDGAFRVFGSNGPFASFSRANTGAPAIIIGRKGSYGKVNWTAKPCFASDTTFFIDESTSLNHLRWIYWLLQTLRLDEGTDEAAIPGLNRETAYARDVLVPPLSHQRAIADYLDRETARLDALVAEKERLLDLLAEKRRSLITRAVTRGLDPNVPLRDSGISWLGEIPAHWEVAALKRVATLKSGESITSNLIDFEGDFPVFGGNGLRGFTSVYSHEGEYVLIGRQGALCGNIHYAYGRFWASEHAVVVTAGEKCNSKWLSELLVVMNLNQYSQSAAQPGLAVEVIENLHIPVPPILEQREIVEFIAGSIIGIDNLRKVTNRTIELLKERRSALISAAVTGQIDMEQVAWKSPR